MGHPAARLQYAFCLEQCLGLKRGASTSFTSYEQSAVGTIFHRNTELAVGHGALDAVNFTFYEQV
jgi:hypothetical protein